MTERRDLLVGIDGGATKCVVRLLDPSGDMLGEARGGPVQIANDLELGWKSICTALDELMQRLGLSYEDVRLFAGVGVAGTESQEVCRRFTETPNPFYRMDLRSDGYTWCLGAHGGKDGGVVAVGTGTVGFAIVGDKNHRVGGWGFPQDDQGGGAWIGRLALSEVLKSRDGRRPRSAFLDHVFDHITKNGGDPYVWGVRATSTKFASLTPLVVEASQNGDRVANDMMDQAAAELTELARSLMSQEGFGHIPFCFVGGLAQFLTPRLSMDVRQRVVPTKGRSSDGALLLARRLYEQERG